MQMKKAFSLSAVMVMVLWILAGSTTFATMDYELLKGLDLNWYFDNPDPNWQKTISYNYFHDYNGDGLPDFLIHQSNDTDTNRIFCLDSSVTEGKKLYPDDRTAWREIAWQEGTFIPDDLHLIKPSSENRTPDLVLHGRDKVSTTDYTKFVFWRLDETQTNFPTEKSWSIDVEAQYKPVLTWSSYSFNEDNYPDFFIYNTYLDDTGKFFIGCYNGLDGSEIWTKSLDKATEDTGAEIFGQKSLLTLYLLFINDNLNITGDFDSDGTPDILLYYTYLKGDMMDFSIRGVLRVLKADGSDFYSPAGWWQIYEYQQTFIRSMGQPSWDFNKDTYVDFSFMNISPSTALGIPVLKVIDFKNKTDLFQTQNSDFGDKAEDLLGYQYYPAFRTDMSSLADLDGDSWWDMGFYRYIGTEQSPLLYGLFHAWAGGGANKGRKMWLQEAADYNAVRYMVNDWNSDNIFDYALINNPEELVSKKATWDYALPSIASDGPTIQKEFQSEMEHGGSWDAGKDDMFANLLGMGTLQDIDGDGQKDTQIVTFLQIDNGNDNVWENKYCRFFVFDNTPGANPPDITADFNASLANEQTNINLSMVFATTYKDSVMIDQNGDGSYNDIVLVSKRAVFALSFIYKPAHDVTVGDIVQVLCGRKQVPAGEEDNYDKNGDGKIDVADVVYLVLNS